MAFYSNGFSHVLQMKDECKILLYDFLLISFYKLLFVLIYAVKKRPVTEK